MVIEVRIVAVLGGRVAERKEPWGRGRGVHLSNKYASMCVYVGSILHRDRVGRTLLSRNHHILSYTDVPFPSKKKKSRRKKSA